MGKKELSTLTRDSDVYNKNIKNKVINDTSNESQIDELSFTDLKINCYWKANWQTLTEKGKTEDISIDDYMEIMNSDKVERAEILHQDITSHTWIIKDKNLSFEFSIVMEGKFALPNGSKIIGKNTFYIKSLSDLFYIGYICSYEQDENKMVDINIKDDSSFIVKINNREYIFNTIENLSKKSSSNKIKQIISYAHNNNRWSKMKIGELKYDNNNNIYLNLHFVNNIKFDDCVINFVFDSSETDNELWTLAENFGYSDLLMLQNEIVYMSFNPYTEKEGIIKQKLWNVKKEKPSQPSFLIRLLSMIYSINWTKKRSLLRHIFK